MRDVAMEGCCEDCLHHDRRGQIVNSWAYLAVHDAAGFAAVAYLVTQGYPWWGGMCLFLVATTTVKLRRAE
jgi:hypothetical protein